MRIIFDDAEPTTSERAMQAALDLMDAYVHPGWEGASCEEEQETSHANPHRHDT